MPSWGEFSPVEQMAVIAAQDAPVAPADARAFAGVIERTQDLLAAQPAPPLISPWTHLLLLVFLLVLPLAPLLLLAFLLI